MTIQCDNWLYVETETADMARKFFGLPSDTEVRLDRVENGRNTWAVRSPVGGQILDTKTGKRLR